MKKRSFPLIFQIRFQHGKSLSFHFYLSRSWRLLLEETSPVVNASTYGKYTHHLRKASDLYYMILQNSRYGEWHTNYVRIISQNVRVRMPNPLCVSMFLYLTVDRSISSMIALCMQCPVSEPMEVDRRSVATDQLSNRRPLHAYITVHAYHVYRI